MLEFAVGVGVGAYAEPAGGVDDAVSAIRHAAAKHLAGLAEGERLAEWAETVFEIAEGLGREVIAEVGRQKGAIDLSFVPGEGPWTLKLNDVASGKKTEAKVSK